MSEQQTAAAAGTKVEIKSRWTGAVLFSCDVPEEHSGMAMRHALERAAESRADLRGAVLSGADLRGADLRDADLRGAVLSGADLRDAVLRDAVLRDAVLRDAVLSRADLSGAVLRDADLRDADLRGADLRDIKADFFDILIRAPREIAGLRDALIAGRVDGSTYEGPCCCLVGTIANVRECSYQALGNGIQPNSSRPAERWFMGISKGDTPETNQVSKLTVEWLDEFVTLLDAAWSAA